MRYLAKADRDHLLMLSAIEITLERVSKEMAEHSRPKEWTKLVRTARTFTDKARQELAKHFTPEERERVYARLRKHHIMIVPSDHGLNKRNGEERYELDHDVWANLTETVLERSCRGCTIQDHMSCRIRQALMESGVPPMEDEIPDTICQYKYD